MTAKNTDSVLLSEQHGRVRVLTLNRPEKLNALNHELVRALLDALRRAASDDSIGAIVLRGAGKAFCAGIDLRETSQLGGKKEIAAHAALVARLQTAFHIADKPVIAAVHGWALGAGCGLVASSDIAVCATDAQLGYPEVTRNVLPALVIPNLMRQIGRKAAFELVASGVPVDAEAAHHLGLVNRIVPNDRLQSDALEFAGTLADRDAATMARLKRLFHRVADMPLAAALSTAQAANAEHRLHRLADRAAAGGGGTPRASARKRATRRS